MSALLSTRSGYMTLTHHSELQLDVKIYFLSFCQLILMILII
jgi:hypothetical protein